MLDVLEDRGYDSNMDVELVWDWITPCAELTHHCSHVVACPNDTSRA